MSATAKSKKSDAFKVGQVWEVVVEVRADTEAASPVEAPVEVVFTNPNGEESMVAGVHQGKGVHVAGLVMTTAGDWTAQARISGPNAGDVDGFTATVK